MGKSGKLVGNKRRSHIVLLIVMLIGVLLFLYEVAVLGNYTLKNFLPLSMYATFSLFLGWELWNGHYNKGLFRLFLYLIVIVSAIYLFFL